MPLSRGVVALAGLLAACASHDLPPPASSPAPPPVVSAVQRTEPRPEHLLARFTFGARPADLAQARSLGARRWLEQQLDPERIARCRALPLPEAYRPASLPPLELAQHFSNEPLDEQDMPPRQLVRQIDFRRLIATAQLAELWRHVSSDCQVYEVMVDFWTNHFNVFARKGLVKLFAADFVERAIRAHALGRFEELLLASAEHPAMLLYLDNAKSNARRGLNENYARELLELHTLGVDGGYTQKDVVEVARILTGFSVKRPREGGLGFVFRRRAHDPGDKIVLGKRYAGDRGQAEGLELLRDLALHPSTARHLARKLCARFVADRAPEPCVQRVAAAHIESGGDVRALLAAVIASPNLDAERAPKLKTPLEFVASALRLLAAEPDGTLSLSRALLELGEPILLMPVPTGYPEAEAAWTSSGALLARLNTARALAAERLAGADVDLDRVLPATDDRAALVAAVNQRLLAGRASATTLAVLRREVSARPDAVAARQTAVALALASPDFQKQ